MGSKPSTLLIRDCQSLTPQPSVFCSFHSQQFGPHIESTTKIAYPRKLAMVTKNPEDIFRVQSVLGNGNAATVSMQIRSPAALAHGLGIISHGICITASVTCLGFIWAAFINVFVRLHLNCKSPEYSWENFEKERKFNPGMDERDRCCVPAPVESEAGGEMDRREWFLLSIPLLVQPRPLEVCAHILCHSPALEAS